MNRKIKLTPETSKELYRLINWLDGEIKENRKALASAKFHYAEDAKRLALLISQSSDADAIFKLTESFVSETQKLQERIRNLEVETQKIVEQSLQISKIQSRWETHNRRRSGLPPEIKSSDTLKEHEAGNCPRTPTLKKTHKTSTSLIWEYVCRDCNSHIWDKA